MRISDWSSDVCSSDLADAGEADGAAKRHHRHEGHRHQPQRATAEEAGEEADADHGEHVVETAQGMQEADGEAAGAAPDTNRGAGMGLRRRGGQEGHDKSGKKAHGNSFGPRRPSAGDREDGRSPRSELLPALAFPADRKSTRLNSSHLY